MESIGSPIPAPPKEAQDKPRRRDREVIGFFSSLIAHLVLLLALALIVQSPMPPNSPLVVQIGDVDSFSEGLEVVDLSEVELEVSSAPSEQLVAIPDLQFVHQVDESKLSPPKPREDPDVSGASDVATPDTAATKKDKGVRFFDTHAYGSKFVYVLDISGSMWAGQGRRMRRAQAELIRSIHDLRPHHEFEVVMYNEKAFTFGPPKLRMATRQNKVLYERWITHMMPQGGTQPGDALRIAGELKPDAVFFLSDGEFVFTAAATPAENLEAFLQSFSNARGRRLQNPQANNKLPKDILKNYPPGVVVHTIAFESRENRNIMEMIAKEKEGQFRFIPAPARPTMRRR